MKPALSTLPSPRQIWAKCSGLARFALYLAGLEILFFLLGLLFRALGFPGLAGTLRGWTGLVGFVLLILLLILSLRWFRRTVMWSLRNRLVVTYVFIGVIPVVLLAIIALVAAYLFAGQFAGYVVHSDIRSELRALQTTASGATEHLVRELKGSANPRETVAKASLENLDSANATSVTVILQSANGAATVRTFPPGSPAITAPSKPRMQDVTGGKEATVQATGREMLGVAEQGRALYLRAVNIVSVDQSKLFVIVSRPMDEALLTHFASSLGELTLFPPDTATGASPSDSGAKQEQPQQPASNDKSIDISIQSSGQVLMENPDSHRMQPALAPLNAGTLPPQAHWYDREVVFGTMFDVIDWDSGRISPALLGIRTRPSLLYGRFFVAVGEVAQGVVLFLIGIAIAFGLIELLALIIGVRLSRTMTRSVYELYTATQHINRGDLTYRISINRQDQLAELETSFNSMSQSLERLIAEQKEKQRIESELAIAQEVQSQLFPRDLSQLATLEMHGVCRPARTVSGDYYDFLRLGGEKLGIAVGDISGKGISAALLMATIHSAVRVYEMGRVPAREQLVAAGAAAVSAAAGGASLLPASVVQSPGSVLSLLNRHLFHSTPPEKYATMFFGLWDGQTKRLSYSNGGHLPPIVIRENGAVEKLETGGTVVGLFEDVAYDEAAVSLRPGDLFVAYSDGLTEPENEFGEFGEQRLIEVARKSRHQSLARISDAVVTSVIDWIGAAEQPDDITLVLVRAR
jgi:sigma-B regulation protein RsbU (phosphoserine phosphatase)